MQDPVFIDTADGKALIADSIKENNKNIDVKTNEVKSEAIKHNNTSETLKEKTKNSNVVSVNIDNIQESRGGMYCKVYKVERVNFSTLNKFFHKHRWN